MHEKGRAVRVRTMEIGMRANEDIEIGQDITEAIPPLSFALHHSLLLSHCSACFAPLPHTNTLYCSSRCANYDSSLSRSLPHSSSAELRAALRLLRSHAAASATDRLAGGLLTNRNKLTAEDDDGVADAIKDGARAMAAAMSERSDSAAAATVALCAVLTNAVEVSDESGLTSLGVAVYGPRFSWIDHSCSPNACYRISLPSEPETTSSLSTASKIIPYFFGSGDNDAAQSIESGDSSDNVLAKVIGGSESCGYGPRITVRSIKRIKKGEEVTVAYTDLLQPKALRQSELWSKYRFICCCRRCSAVPPTYVDGALEEISVADVHSSSSTIAFDKDKATELLTEYINDAVANYLSVGDAQSCSEKLERLLTRGVLNEQSESDKERAQPTYWLHPLHHLSLNAYTTLASTYKTRANDMLAQVSEMNGNLRDAFDMSRISAAYSLLLAGTTNHLFRHEPSLMASAAHFWASAGESLVAFARSLAWSEFMPVSNISSTTKYQICPKCSLHNIFGTNPCYGQVNQYADFENVSRQFLDCVTCYAQSVWRPLVRSCHPLRTFTDPIDFSWLETSKYSCILNESCSHSRVNDANSNSGSEKNISRCELQGCTSLERVHLHQLGVHCLLYGGYLASISLGGHSYLTRHVNYILGG